MIVLDTNILIEILKNNQKIIKKVTALQPPLHISSISAMELIYGARNNEEVKLLNAFISKFSVIHLDEKISQRALGLINKYAKSHNLDIPDALIAATSLHNSNELFTLNTKDFKFIEGIQLL